MTQNLPQQVASQHNEINFSVNIAFGVTDLNTLIESFRVTNIFEFFIKNLPGLSTFPIPQYVCIYQ